MFSLEQNDNFFSKIYNCAVKLRRWSAFVVYLALLIDNILLTMVVPIIPVYLNVLENCDQKSLSTIFPGIFLNNETTQLASDIKIANSAKFFHSDDDSGTIGSLLASKAIVQLACNPFVSILINRWGYAMPQLIGTIILLFSSILYAIGNSYWYFLVARCIQGIASACITVSGMSTIAESYPNEEERSYVMGYILGGIAFGVLIGYPFGGLSYDFIGKSTPFIVVFALTMLLIGAITVSTVSMSILESSLPVWLIDTLHPPEWQLGTVFIPDSIGYLIGTNLFAGIAYKYGRWLTALLSLILVGICAMSIPFANAMMHLILPHFGLGLGIGITDAAMVPLLANIVDTRHNLTLYGSVYALSQMAVCLAYSLGPLIGGQLQQYMGFPSLIRIVGFINIIYCPLCLFLRGVCQKQCEVIENSEEQKQIVMNAQKSSSKYASIDQNRGGYWTFFDEDQD